jgi:chorismate mutase
MPKTPKRKSKAKKPKQKQKQKQIVKQNVKVNVQSSGGSGAGGSSIPTIPQYIPQPYNIPQSFRDTRGEDVALESLSKKIDKFMEKPQPVESSPPTAFLPLEYNDSAVDANQNNQLVANVYQSRPKQNQNLLSELPFNEDPMFDLLNNRTSKVERIEVLKSKDDYKKQTEKAREARQINRLKRDDERRQMENEDRLSKLMMSQVEEPKKEKRKQKKSSSK